MKLIDYIQGKRRGQEANKLEREAMNDPFLQDAMDGFDAVPGDHVEAIRDLERKITEKTTNRKSLISYRTWAIGAAASVILILGIGSLLHTGTQKPENTAVTTPKRVALPPKDTLKLIEPIKTSTKKLIAGQLKNSKQFSASTNNQLQPTHSEEEQLKTQDELSETKMAISVADVADAMSFRQQDSNTKISANSQIDVADVKASPQLILGKVTDEKGEPLIGATVRLKNINTGTITKQDGTFDLPTPKTKSDKIEVSYIGYEKEEVPVSGNSYIIKLKPDPTFGEVVVIGHPEKSKSSVVGSITYKENRATDFNENEFITYYKAYHKADLCTDQKYVLKAKFRIDENGNPVKIKVTKSPCEEIKQEFILLLNANKWSKKNRNVSLKIEME